MIRWWRRERARQAQVEALFEEAIERLRVQTAATYRLALSGALHAEHMETKQKGDSGHAG